MNPQAFAAWIRYAPDYPWCLAATSSTDAGCRVLLDLELAQRQPASSGVVLPWGLPPTYELRKRRKKR